MRREHCAWTLGKSAQMMQQQCFAIIQILKVMIVIYASSAFTFSRRPICPVNARKSLRHWVVLRKRNSSPNARSRYSTMKLESLFTPNSALGSVPNGAAVGHGVALFFWKKDSDVPESFVQIVMKHYIPSLFFTVPQKTEKCKGTVQSPIFEHGPSH